MYYNHLLRTNIQEWRNQLYKSNFEDFTDNFIFFIDKINKEICLKNLLIETTSKYPLTNKELEDWMEQLYYNKIKYENQEHKISYLIHTILYFYNKKEAPTYYNFLGGHGTDNNQSFLDRMITPVVNYLHESLDEVNTTLYIIEKYKLRTEWFTKESLKEKYYSVTNKQYEQVLEDDMRLYLFDQGIHYPFSTPKSASGRADVISLIDTEDPLVMEIKVYDSSKGYKKDRIIKGFSQIVKYTNDYHKNTGYLTIFNLDNVEIEIISNDPNKLWPNRLLFNGKTYYVIIVNLNYDITASKLGILNKLSLDISELTSSI